MGSLLLTAAHVFTDSEIANAVSCIAGF